MGYSTLPGVFPRFRELFGSGFGQLAFLFAYVFQAARILPVGHPYLNPANIGKFTIRQVFAQGAGHLVFDRRHIDQVIIFGTLMCGFVLLALQFVFLTCFLVIRPAAAAITIPFSGMFDTPVAQRDTDIALQLLDKIFGVPGFFGSIYDTGAPMPFQEALQELFQFYSYALLLVGVIIFLYYALVLVAETAQTGTPFGRRFSHIWAPLRLVVAIGLLVPLTWGYNSAQYIVLFTAKMGSGFATNAWLLYNSSLDNALGTKNESLFARPKVPDSWPIVKFMLLAGTCRESYERLGVTDIKPWLVKNNVAPEDPGIGYANAVNFYGNRDVVIVFGKHEPNGAHDSAKYDSQVVPYCGSVVIYTHTPLDGSSGTPEEAALAGPWGVQEGYYNMIRFLWAPPGGTLGQNDFVNLMASWYLPENSGTCTMPSGAFPGIDCTNGVTPEYFKEIKNNRQQLFEAQVSSAYTNMVSSATAANALAMPAGIAELGWGGAGIWYNKVAEMNGIFTDAVIYLPSPNELPMPMKTVVQQKRAQNSKDGVKDIFAPQMANGQKVDFTGDRDAELVAYVLYQAYTKMGNDDLVMESDTVKKQNVFVDTINYFIGLNGLFTIRENVDIHPLAQLVALGKGIVDGAVRSLFTATLFSFGAGLAGALPDGLSAIGGFLDAASKIFTTIATLGLSVGFVLYYVIPFMPFIYFYFAVGAWIKTVFEAMVGVPLWALAHLRIDGYGLPGESAMSGYLMILEIFLRPILTVFGLIGALIIFTAMVRTLNDIFDLVTANLAGFDNNPCDAAAGGCSFSDSVTIDPANTVVTDLLKFKRDVIDEFFFTIIYTIIVYMLATASFKMIDQVPQQILRWMGGGAQVFADSMPDATENLKQHVAVGGYMMTNTLTSGLIGSSKQFAQGLSKTIAGDNKTAKVGGKGSGGSDTPNLPGTKP